jgi:peptide deformylase
MVEGCLSVFNSELFGSVVRPEKITLKYLDETFTEITEEYDGMFARAIQHEIDHLNGILFTDIVDAKSISSLEEYRKQRVK